MTVIGWATSTVIRIVEKARRRALPDAVIELHEKYFSNYQKEVSHGSAGWPIESVLFIKWSTIASCRSKVMWHLHTKLLSWIFSLSIRSTKVFIKSLSKQSKSPSILSLSQTGLVLFQTPCSQFWRLPTEASAKEGNELSFLAHSSESSLTNDLTYRIGVTWCLQGSLLTETSSSVFSNLIRRTIVPEESSPQRMQEFLDCAVSWKNFERQWIRFPSTHKRWRVSRHAKKPGLLEKYCFLLLTAITNY